MTIQVQICPRFIKWQLGYINTEMMAVFPKLLSVLCMYIVYELLSTSVRLVGFMWLERTPFRE